MKTYQRKNREKINKTKRLYRERKRDEAKKRNLIWREEPKVVVDERRNRWRNENVEHVKKYAREYMRKVRKENPQVRIRQSLSARLRSLLKGENKSIRTVEVVGCSYEELRKYLEDKFQNGMSWNNYGRGGWHIDHIKPCNLFDLTNPGELKKCFHFSNLQPLWEKENIVKSNKYES